MGYFFGHTLSDGSGHGSPSCQTSESIITNGGTINENPNGTVTVYNGDGTFRPLTKTCCEVLNPSYIFNIDKQECRWGDNCIDNSQPFQLMLNPIGNSGTIFDVDEENGETCILNITFDYLFQLDCDDIYDALQANQLNTLNNETQEYVNTLSGRCEEINTIISNLEYNLLVLNTELTNTPYVIQCDKPVRSGDNEPLPTPTSDFNLLLPPNAFPNQNYGTFTYCLTELGLSSWNTILGTVDYDDWLASNGTNTSLYTCTDVDTLIALDDGTGDLIGSCDVTITAKQEIILQMTQTQEEIMHLTDECANNQAIIDDLLGNTNCNTLLEMLESFDVSVTLDVVDSGLTTTTTVYEEPLFNIGAGNLVDYLVENPNATGFYISGSETNSLCEVIEGGLVDDIIAIGGGSLETVSEVIDLVNSAFTSTWLNADINITDQAIISGITGEEIKISIKVNNCCMDFGVLIDRITMDKDCTKIESSDIRISKCPSFNMIRVCDNKKSWLTNEDDEYREFDLKLRGTGYDINDYRLAINSKEVDLDINPANAIEQDLYCYVRDNSCLLDCTTGTTSATASTDYDFGVILSAQTLLCESDFNSGCTVNSNWTIDVTLGCETIYTNNSFYVSTGITDSPTQQMYIDALSGMATTLGLEFTSGATSVTFTDMVDCDESIIFLNETFKIDLGLDITTDCPKHFQDGDNFLFQDGESYEFN